MIAVDAFSPPFFVVPLTQQIPNGPTGVRLQILDAALCQQVSKEECLMVVEQEDLEVRQR